MDLLDGRFTGKNLQVGAVSGQRNEINISENTQRSESFIRDTDMSKEMVKYSKENILLRAGHKIKLTYEREDMA